MSETTTIEPEKQSVTSTLTAAMNQEALRDRKLWRELVLESAEQGADPDPSIIRRLGAAWSLDGQQSLDAFAVDVAAVQTVKKQFHRQKSAQKKVDQFVQEHGEIKVLKLQLADMLTQSRELERTIRQADHRETATHRYTHQISRIKGQTHRIYGDPKSD